MQCKKCQEVIGESNFCASKPSWCRPCYIEYHREYRRKNAEKLRTQQYERWINNKEKKLAQAKAWRERNHEERLEVERSCREKKDRSAYHKEYAAKNRGRIRENQKRYRDKNKLKTLAQAKLHYHKSVGNIEVPDCCEMCEKFKPVEAHHYEYSKPLDVTWLCVTCHNKVHKIIKSKEIKDG
jgi:hypothetical protein